MLAHLIIDAADIGVDPEVFAHCRDLIGHPRESESRRRSWTEGDPVTLANGTVWHLPRLDLFRLALIPGLAAMLLQMIDLAQPLGVAPIDERRWQRWRVAVVDVGAALFRSNYDLAGAPRTPSTSLGSGGSG